MVTRSHPVQIGLPEAARRLGLHRATVNDMVQSGRIAAQRVGAQWYIEEPDLDRFAAAYERPRNAPRRPARSLLVSGEILDRLADWGEGSVQELAAVVDLHEGNIRKHLCIAEAQGLAQRDDSGRWSLTSGGLRQGRWSA